MTRIDRTDEGLSLARRELRGALDAASYSYCGGSTHGFYHYPARFSPDIARSVIELFTSAGDVVLDPFMGGGTSIIEGLALGRQMLGVDLNALAHFVTTARTTPLSDTDGSVVRQWAHDTAQLCTRVGIDALGEKRVRNLPPAVEKFMSHAGVLVDQLPFPRQRAFARCALLRVGQVTLDCRDISAPRRSQLARRLPAQVDQMLGGMSEFVAVCRAAGIAKNEIVRRRTLLHRSAVGIEDDACFRLVARPRLVFTSPPYPSVHVLYHRWQYRGRRETPAPYWIAQVPDGYDASYYCGGSRTPTGQDHYFSMIAAGFSSVREVIHSRGLVVQLVGFSDKRSQLPRYLDAMNAAGFDEIRATSGSALGRRVPNRKWYARLQGEVDASAELVLVHRPRPRRLPRPSPRTTPQSPQG